MTYVELIVVLSIFAIMSAAVLFNYGKFQAKVDIKNLANDIAQKIVQAQKDAMSGKWTTGADPNWKPSYGVYFDLSNPQNFVYFADLSNDTFFGDPVCSGECLDNIKITKGDYIAQLDSYLGTTPTSISNPLSITFTRPKSEAVFVNYPSGSILNGFDYVQITITSPQLIKAYIKIYPSGRIQIN